MMRRALVAALVVLALAFWADSPAGADIHLRLTGSPIAWIGGGWFEQGSTPSEVRYAHGLCLRPDELSLRGCGERFRWEQTPTFTVHVSAYGLDRREVTQAAYRRCVAANECTPPHASEVDPRVAGRDRPVVGVDWHQAGAFCAWAGGRLPTEAEWEHAARGHSRRRYPWGQIYNDRLANHGRSSGIQEGLRGLATNGLPDDRDGYRYAAPVGSYPDGASIHGVLDMAGNVWEWTADGFDQHSTGVSDRVDPQMPNVSGRHIVRGGSWRSPVYELRVTHRLPFTAMSASSDLGFRCAYDANRPRPGTVILR